MLLGAAKFHLVWRARLGLEPRLCGGQLATGSDELFKQVLPDAVKAGNFRRIGFRARRHSRLELLAQGGRLSPKPNEFLKLVRTNVIEPLDFHARRLRGPARFHKLTSLIRTGLFDARAFRSPFRGCDGDRQSADAEGHDCACRNAKGAWGSPTHRSNHDQHSAAGEPLRPAPKLPPLNLRREIV